MSSNAIKPVDNPDYRHYIGELSSLPNHKPVKFESQGKDYLVVRQDNEVQVLDGACPHLGGDLSEGLLVENTITCPLHRARFDVRSGKLLEPPGCEHLQHYAVDISQQSVYAHLNSESSNAHSEGGGSTQTAQCEDAPRTIAIVGAGAAGMAAATKLRDEEFTGEIILITEEQQLPYERTKLSKSIVSKPDDAQVLSEKDLEGLNITYRSDFRVEEISWSNGISISGKNTSVSADRLILATGSRPRHLNVEGESLDGVFQLRSMSDARLLELKQRKASRIVLVGGGFISLELAATLNEKHQVTVILNDNLPLQKLLGQAVAQRLKCEFVDGGVEFNENIEVASFEGDTKLESVVLQNGKRIVADLAVVAIGADPELDTLPKTCIDDRGSVSTDAKLGLVDAQHVYVAGDIAAVPSAWGSFRIEHWRWAQQMGRAAALNALGAGQPFRAAPFFWTALCATGSYIYIGHARDWDRIAFTGSVDDKDFIAWYVDGDRVPAVFGHGYTDLLSTIERAMHTDGPLNVSDWAEYIT